MFNLLKARQQLKGNKNNYFLCMPYYVGDINIVLLFLRIQLRYLISNKLITY